MPGVKLHESLATEFHVAVEQVLTAVQLSISALVSALPGPISRAVELERVLDLDKKLAWQIFKLSTAGGLDRVSHVPARASMKRLIAASERVGVERPVLDAVWAAFERLESFAEVQAGGRAGLMSMVSGFSGESSEQYELSVRKSLYEANAHIWGLRAQLKTRTVICCPRSGNESTRREVLVGGNLGMHGIRRGEPLVVSSWVKSFDDISRTPSSPRAAEGVVISGENGSFRLIEEYCTQPLPEMIERRGPSGAPETEILIPPTGRPGALSMHFRQELQSDALLKSTRSNVAGMFISVPAAEVIVEMLIPTGECDPSSARVTIFGRRHHPELAFEERRVDLLPQHEAVSYVGPASEVMPMTGSAHHHLAVGKTLEELGLSDVKWDQFRCRVRFPVLHTVIVMRVDGE